MCTEAILFIARDLYFTIDYSSPAAVQNYDDMMLSLKSGLRQKTFERLLLDCSVTQLRYVNDAYDNIPSFENLTPFQWLISHKPDVCRLMSVRKVIREVFGHASEQELHPGFSAVSYCRRIICSIFTVVITRIRKCSSQAVDIRIDSDYERSSPSRWIFRCIQTPPNTRLFPGQLDYFGPDDLFHLHSFPLGARDRIMHIRHCSYLAAKARLVYKLVAL